jgi:hypothetical protein
MKAIPFPSISPVPVMVICFRSIRNYSPIFSTIANIVDVKMRYLAGISDSTVDLHADYIVSTDKLKKMIDYNED